jgi:hypothetical protein
MRIVALRPVDEDNADPISVEFFENDHLVYVVARKAVRVDSTMLRSVRRNKQTRHARTLA